MSYYAISALINCVLSSFLGSIVFKKNPKSKINLTFSLFAFDVAAWSLAYFFWQVAASVADALFWSRALMAFAIFIPAFYLHFVFTLIGNYRKAILAFTYVIFFIFVLIDLSTSQFVTGVQPTSSFNYWPTPGPVFHLFLLVWAGYVVYSTYLLYRLHQRSDEVTKMQSQYLLWGMIIGFAGGSTNYFLWYGIAILPLGNILVSVYVAMTAYAIVRHRFLDIRLVLARTIAYSLLVTLIGIFYTGAAFALSALFLGSISSQGQLFVYMVLTIVIALSFENLKNLVERLTDKIFYKGRYDSNQLLSTLAHIMSTNIELKSLTSKIIQALIMEMKVSRGAFILLENNSSHETISVGFPDKLNTEYFKFTSLLDIHEMAVFDELEEGTLKQDMRALNISIAKVLHVKQGIIGYLVLGEKASGEMYSQQDLKILDILAPEVTIAIQNSQAFEQIQKFNVVLSDEVKKATSDLRDANQKLKDLDQLKDDFVSIASHELRTPMTAIKSYLWMAINRPDIKLSEKMSKYLSRAYISTERLINLVNDMLNVSRIESGRIEIRPRAFDIPGLVEEVISEVKPKADEKMVNLKVEKENIPQVFADPDKVHQVLLNLIGNALKFTPVSGNVSVSFFSDGQVVEVSIKDSGVGISKDDLARLFQKFGRLDNSYVAAATVGGTGLGLYISKSLIELMKGQIRATSEGMGKGSTFTFSLPVASSDILSQAEKYTRQAVGEAKGLEPVSI